MPSSVIPLALAKDKLEEIDKDLVDNYLLIGGIAVNHYVKTRNSHDIDLICTHEQATKLLESFPSAAWNVDDRNDDPERPSYVVQNKKNPNIILKFGPKIVERGAYPYLDWEILAKNSTPLTNKKVPLKHILIPNAAYLAYSKLISFFNRADPVKKTQDLKDFIDLSNSNEFSYTRFLSILEQLKALEMVQSHYAAFLDAYKRAGVSSLLFQLIEVFSERPKAPEAERPKAAEAGRTPYGSPEFIGRILDAAIYVRDNATFATEEIRMAVESKRLFPVRLLYRTEEGVRSWLDLCESPRYSFYLSSYNNFDGSVSGLVELICKSANGAPLNLVSLGVGDGKKERLLVEALLTRCDRDSNLHYYPVDLSLNMIERTAKQLSQSPMIRSGAAGLSIKPIVGDFLGIHSMDPIYSHRNGTNIFSILGNTIGNGPEYEFFNALMDAVRPGDFVLIEVDTDQDGALNSDFATSSENRRVDLAPLLAAGYTCSEKDLRYLVIKEKNTYSLVPGTISIAAECDVTRKATISKARTSIVHHYQLEKFADEVAARLDMKVLHRSESKGVGLVLLQKSPDS